MQLTTRSFLLLLATVIPLALAERVDWAGWLAFGWLLAVVIFLVADWLLTPSPAAWKATRTHEDRLSLAAPNPITLTIDLRAGIRPLTLWVRDTPPESFHVDDTARILTTQVAPGERATLSYTVTPPRRGDYQFGDIYLRWASPLGLLKRETRVAASGPVRVYPNLEDVRTYDLLLRRHRLWEMGVRTQRQRGAGGEFEQLREYLPDDEYRRINWKATARRGKPITTEFQSERSQNIVVLLEIGRMMRSPVGEVAKVDYAINAVLLLAWVAGQKGDKVGLMTFADTVHTWVPPRAGKAQFPLLLEQLHAVDAEPVEPDYGAAASVLSERLNKHSLVIVFTELTGSVSTEMLIQQMIRMRRTHLPLLVTVGDPTVQRLAEQPVIDSDTLYQRTVAEGLLEERRLVLDRLRRAGVLTLDAPADRLSVAAINQYLAIKERMLL